MPLKNITKSRDLHEIVKNTLRFLLSIENISGIVTDGTPAMVGKNEGLVKLMMMMMIMMMQLSKKFIFDEISLHNTLRKFMLKNRYHENCHQGCEYYKGQGIKSLPIPRIFKKYEC